MDKYIYDENNGLWYELQGDYYIPCLELPTEKEERHIGVWGRRHLRYIRENHEGLYNSLFLSGKLNGYLTDLNEQAEDMFLRLVKELAEEDDVTETLKAADQMEWVRRMNAVREAAMEIVNNKLRQHRTIRLRHLPEKLRPDLVTFSCNTQSITAKKRRHQNAIFLGICFCRIMRYCHKFVFEAALPS